MARLLHSCTVSTSLSVLLLLSGARLEAAVAADGEIIRYELIPMIYVGVPMIGSLVARIPDAPMPPDAEHALHGTISLLEVVQGSEYEVVLMELYSSPEIEPWAEPITIRATEGSIEIVPDDSGTASVRIWIPAQIDGEDVTLTDDNDPDTFVGSPPSIRRLSMTARTMHPPPLGGRIVLLVYAEPEPISLATPTSSSTPTVQEARTEAPLPPSPTPAPPLTPSETEGPMPATPAATASETRTVTSTPMAPTAMGTTATPSFAETSTPPSTPASRDVGSAESGCSVRLAREGTTCWPIWLYAVALARPFSRFVAAMRSLPWSR